MTKDKMLELWHKKLEDGYYKVKFLPQVYDYLEQKTDKLPQNPTNGDTTYVDYEEWLVKELDGENAELARRMLLIISKIRREGPIGRYGNSSDIEICLRIGYSINTVLKEFILPIKYFDALEKYELVETFIKNRPAEVEAFADLILTKQLQKWDKNDNEFCLALYAAVIFLKKDTAKYNRYLPALITATEKGGNSTLGMLYYGYRLSPCLKDILLKRLTTSTFDIHIFYLYWAKTDMPSILEEIGAPQWPYYYAVATYYNDQIDKVSILCELYKRDKTTFIETLAHLPNITEPTRWALDGQISSLCMLAILLQNGEGKDHLEEYLDVMKQLINHFLIIYTRFKPSKYNLTDSQFIQGFVDITQLRKFFAHAGDLKCQYISINSIKAFGLLYEYSSIAKYFIDHLLLQIPEIDYHNNLFVIVSSILKARKDWLGISYHDSLEILLNDDNELTIFDAIKTYCFEPDVMADAIDIKKYKKEATDVLTNGNLNSTETVTWLNYIYTLHDLKDYQPLISLLSSKSNPVRAQVGTIISAKKSEIRPALESQMKTMKGTALVSAKNLIKCWDNEQKFGAGFTFDKASVVEFCKDNYEKSNQKYISWIPEHMFENIRFSDLTDKAPAIILQYILTEYLSQMKPYKIQVCDKIVEQLHLGDLQAALENIYQYWLEGSADSTRKMIMIPYCMYGSDSQILKLKAQLKTWVKSSRSVLAAFTVNAIALNGGSVALMMIDDISNKFPNAKVKKTAKAAFSFAAQALNVQEDELSDKIVPTLGFSKEGEKTIDYGARIFTVTLMPDFSLSIYDNDKQKNIKSMPAPGANDDIVKATSGKKEFAELKKQIKVTVQLQTNRLSQFLIDGRRWSVKSWSNLFVENPIMHRFAIGLIWGVYKNDELISTFRYMDDGTFNTVNEEEFTLPENADITLVHPIELSKETLSQWKEQLDDYEITQPIQQLTAPIVTWTEKDFSKKAITRYEGTVVKASKITSLVSKYNMIRGAVEDAGCFYNYHWIDKYLRIGVLLNFDYMYMGQNYEEDVTLKEVEFYRLEEDLQIIEYPKNESLIDPKSLPRRFICGVMGMFDVLLNE